jgi:predicted metal-binding membrane protein
MDASPRPGAARAETQATGAAAVLKAAPAGLLVSLVVLTLAAWAVTVIEAQHMNMPMGVAMRGGAAAGGMAGMAMAGASAGGRSVGGAALFVGVWTVMMAAMMLPSAAPMILIFAGAQAKRGRSGATVRTCVFIAGYLLVWAAAGAAVYVAVQAVSEAALRLGLTGRARWAPIALGVTIAAAGLYQLTPLKRICLAHCRSPFAFVAEHWREGLAGALAMGLRHGAWCLGCCWALFAVLAAAGAMSLAWMLLLTLVVFAEKVLPHGRAAAVAAGVALLVFGAVVSLGAGSAS